MYVAASARLVLARRPWIYWVVVAALAGFIAVAVTNQVATIGAARDSWGTTRPVLVADRGLAPGEPIDVRVVELPIAVLPDGALSDLPAGAVLHQRIARGEVVTDIDVAVGDGPAARADQGTVVVGVTDPLAQHLTIGLRVQVAADGIVIAASATVVDLADDIVFVAVDPDAAPTVAAAAQQGQASLMFVP